MSKRTLLAPLAGAWALATFVVSACSSPPPPAPPAAKAPPFQVVADIKLLMAGIVDPAADAVWQSVSIYIDKTGETHKRPRTEAEWTIVRNHALTLAESGNLLMIAPRARDDGDWMKFSRAMVDAGTKAYEATLNKDADELLLIGGDIYETCVSCHAKYLPPGAELELGE